MSIEYDQLIKCLQKFPSKQWLNQYFDLQKRLLNDLEIEYNDPRLSLSFAQNKMPVNLGQRYILRPHIKGNVSCITPIGFEEETVDGKCTWLFSHNKVVDAKWIEVAFPVGKSISPLLYHACLEACTAILQKAKRSGYRRYHIPLLYDFTMEPAVRSEILNEIS